MALRAPRTSKFKEMPWVEEQLRPLRAGCHTGVAVPGYGVTVAGACWHGREGVTAARWGAGWVPGPWPCHWDTSGTGDTSGAAQGGFCSVRSSGPIWALLRAHLVLGTHLGAAQGRFCGVRRLCRR